MIFINQSQMRFKTYINFDADIKITDKFNKEINITEDFLEKLNEELYENKLGRINSDGYLYSRHFGLIDIVDCKIKQKPITEKNNLNFKIFIHNNKRNINDIEDAEEIIWTILKIKYDYRFAKQNLDIKGYFNKLKYNFELIDIPSNIYIINYGL